MRREGECGEEVNGDASGRLEGEEEPPYQNLPLPPSTFCPLVGPADQGFPSLSASTADRMFCPLDQEALGWGARGEEHGCSALRGGDGTGGG